MAPKKAKLPAVGTGAVTGTQVAFMVECYLRDNHFNKTLEAFRLEASRVLPKQAMPKQARCLGEVLNDYVVLKEEQLSFATEKARVDHLFQGLQNILSMYHSGDRYGQTWPFQQTLASDSSSGIGKRVTQDQQQGTPALRLASCPNVSSQSATRLKRKASGLGDGESLQKSSEAKTSCQQGGDLEGLTPLFNISSSNVAKELKHDSCRGSPSPSVSIGDPQLPSAAIFQATQPTTPPMNASAKSQQAAAGHNRQSLSPLIEHNSLSVGVLPPRHHHPHTPTTSSTLSRSVGALETSMEARRHPTSKTQSASASRENAVAQQKMRMDLAASGGPNNRLQARGTTSGRSTKGSSKCRLLDFSSVVEETKIKENVCLSLPESATTSSPAQCVPIIDDQRAPLVSQESEILSIGDDDYFDLFSLEIDAALMSELEELPAINVAMNVDGSMGDVDVLGILTEKDPNRLPNQKLTERDLDSPRKMQGLGLGGGQENNPSVAAKDGVNG